MSSGRELRNSRPLSSRFGCFHGFLDVLQSLLLVTAASPADFVFVLERWPASDMVGQPASSYDTLG